LTILHCLQILINAAPLPNSVVCGEAALSQVGQLLDLDWSCSKQLARVVGFFSGQQELQQLLQALRGSA
jgi:hypothetical protein